LLNGGDTAETLRRLSDERNPVYAEADIVVHSQEDPPEVTTDIVFKALATHIPLRRVSVRLSQASYDVLIGTNLLNRAGKLSAPGMPRQRCVIVTDATVAALHLAALQQSLTDSAITYDTIIVPAGEASKSIETWNTVVEGLLAKAVDRQTTIVALGGGVIGDLTGFAAAVTLRGLPFIQIPTTLLAQVDSSVGGKTGINSPFGKNLIGAFHQPRLVLADIGLLGTLPLRHRRAGYAEILKAAVVADESLYEWCEANAERLLEGDALCLADAVERAVLFKATVVAGDEREEKNVDGRALLNFGHTFGHALEAETGYGDSLLHGEAVATGIVLAMQLSASLGFCRHDDAIRVSDHLERLGLPTRINNLPAEHLLAHMRRDKKMRDGKLAFVLARGIGHGFTSSDVPEAAVKAVLLSGGAV
jgi:shikimate kinase/3-dehydroquinate synthase